MNIKLYLCPTLNSNLEMTLTDRICIIILKRITIRGELEVYLALFQTSHTPSTFELTIWSENMWQS